MQRKNMWKEYTEIQQKELEELSVRYKECLDIGKTERELSLIHIYPRYR